MNREYPGFCFVRITCANMQVWKFESFWDILIFRQDKCIGHVFYWTNPGNGKNDLIEHRPIKVNLSKGRGTKPRA